MQHNSVSIFDRITAAASYMTLGTVGMIWFLVNYIFIKKPMSKFLMCNLIQSFIISLIYAVFTYAYNIFMDIFINLPFIGKIFLAMHILLFNNHMFYTLSLMNFTMLLFTVYLSVLAIFGALPYVPYITNMTKRFF